MATKASTVYGASSGGNRPNGLQGFSFGLAGTANGIGFGVATGINISTGLNTVLSLSGRFSVSELYISLLDTTANSLRITLEVDGVIVADSTQAASTISSAQVITSASPILCQSSMILKAQKVASTAISVTYRAISVL